MTRDAMAEARKHLKFKKLCEKAKIEIYQQEAVPAALKHLRESVEESSIGGPINADVKKGFLLAKIMFFIFIDKEIDKLNK